MLEYKRDTMISDKENIAINEHIQTEFVESHIHDFFELVYIEEGSGTHYIDDVEYKVGHGDLIFISRNQTHSYKVLNKMKLVDILINPEFISSELIDSESIVTLFRHSMFAEFEVAAVPVCQRVRFKSNELKEMDALIGMMIREYEQKESGYRSVLQGGVRILFSKILRCMQKTEPDRGSESEELFRDILNFIDENYSQKISLSEIAAKTFYNPVYFGNMLKKYCGRSFSVYLKEKRISKAADMFKTTNKSVEEVMADVGYSDRKLFYAHFKEMYGITPGKYR